MRRFLFAMVMVAAAPLGAEELVSRVIINEKPLSGAEGLKVVVSKLTIKPGGRIPLHTHAGDEHSVIVTGGQALMPDGSELDFPDGTPLFFAAEQVHGGVTNRGDTDMEIVTTHIVKTDAPFQTPAE